MSAVSDHGLLSRLRDSVHRPLSDLRRRCRQYLALGGAVRLLFGMVAAGLAQLLLDRWLRLTVDQRAVMNIAITLLWLWIIFRYLVQPLLRPLPDVLLARAVDQRHPHLQDRLAAAVQFADPGAARPSRDSPQLIDAVVHEACEAADRVSFLDALNHRRARRSGVELAILFMLVLFAWVVMPGTMSTWFRRNWLVQDVAWPQRTHIVPIGFDQAGVRRMPIDDPLQIVADVIGRAPDIINIEWWTAGARGREPMTLVGQARAETTLGPLRGDVRFRISGGDERTREYLVRAVERPAVVSTVARITPPAYTGQEPFSVEQHSLLEFPVGSALLLEARLNKPVRQARFLDSNGAAAPSALVEPNLVRVDWPSPSAGSFAFELEDEDGWAGRRGARITIKIVPDSPPAVRLTVASLRNRVTPTAGLPIALVATDNFGLASVDLWAQRGADPAVRIPLPAAESLGDEYTGEVRFEVSSLRAAPGDRVKIWAEAADRFPDPPGVGRGEVVELRVLTPVDYLSALAQDELELRQEFERLIGEQNGLRDALERLVPELPRAAEPTSAIGQRLSGLARRQDGLTARVRNIRKGFDAILEDMRVNRVVRTADERRIADRIVAPLDEIAGQVMQRASAALNSLRKRVDAEAADGVLPDQAEILRRLRAVLAHMLESEGFREAVAQLQELIDEQTRVRKATADAASSEIDAIIGLEPEDAHETPEKPKP